MYKMLVASPVECSADTNLAGPGFRPYGRHSLTRDWQVAAVRQSWTELTMDGWITEVQAQCHDV